jgi:hypothetical protein
MQWHAKVRRHGLENSMRLLEKNTSRRQQPPASQALGIVNHPRDLVRVLTLDGEQFGLVLFCELHGDIQGAGPRGREQGEKWGWH